MEVTLKDVLGDLEDIANVLEVTEFADSNHTKSAINLALSKLHEIKSEIKEELENKKQVEGIRHGSNKHITESDTKDKE